MSNMQATRPNVGRQPSARTGTTTPAADTTTSPTRIRRASRSASGSLIQLNPLISSDSFDASQLDEAEKCWICFGSRSEEIDEGSTHGKWKSPCKCALIAHEGCLLDWITELEKDTSVNKAIQCPQCKTEIKLRQQRSLAVDIGKRVERLTRATIPIAIIAGIGSIIFITCTVYGVNTVYLVCGTKKASEILLTSNGTEFEWTWRLGVGLPLIPIVLISSRTRLLDATLPVLPFIFFCHHDPLHFTFPPSPAITLAVLPYLRGIYNSLYDRILLPYDKKWSSQLEREGTNTEEGPAVIIEEIVEEEIDQAAEAAPPVAAEEEANDGWAAREMGIGRGNNVINLGAGFSRSIVEALLFPTVMAGMGTILGRFQRIRKLLPESFHRNILGGCLFVILKDLFALYYKYKRAKQRSTRTIVDYKKALAQRKGKSKADS